MGRLIEEPAVFALASAAGRGAVAILRLSGAGVGAIVAQLTGGLPPPRRASLRRLQDADGAILDAALVLWFPAPASFTGESCAELHLHGGRAVVHAVSETLISLGTRPAEPGEFSRRAFLNGKLDLVEAEGIADLVAAETEGQRRQALRQMEGALSSVLQEWADRLQRMLAFQEALIDFPDETLPEEVEAELSAEIVALSGELDAMLADGRRGERLREGLVIAVTGPPNVGKSSLVNALVRQDVAIVSPFAGTTRDALEVRLDLDGILATLVDTAGLRETSDPVEAEGVRRARLRAAEADLVVQVCDAAFPEEPANDPRVLQVANKSDLAPAPSGILGVSALTGAGVADLRAALTARARALVDREGPPPLTRERHRVALEDSRAALRAAADAGLPELRGEELRIALRHLGRITGQVNVEDLLDTIFGAFCIGK